MGQDWARSVSPEDVKGHDELKWAIFLSVIFLYTKNCQYILVDQTMSICLTECVASEIKFQLHFKFDKVEVFFFSVI